MTHASTTTPENAATWRDLAEQLRAEDFASLIKGEEEGDSQTLLLELARLFACQNAATSIYGDDDTPPAEEWRDSCADVAEPEDATWVSAWTLQGGEMRLFQGTRREAPSDTCVVIFGAQLRNGTVLPRMILVENPHLGHLTFEVETAREAGAELFAMAAEQGRTDGMAIGATVLAAVDEIDQLEP